MSPAWTRLSARVNALSVRERFLLFLVLVSLLGAATHLLFIAPLLALQKARVAQIEQGSAASEEQIGRLQLDILARRRMVAEDLAAQAAALQGEVEALDHEIAEISAASNEAAALPAMLRRVLRSSDKVALMRVSPSAEAAAAGVAIGPPQANGLDITLAGGYLDLMEYLAALEAALPHSRWSALRVSAEASPVQASVRIMTPRAAP